MAFKFNRTDKITFYETAPYPAAVSLLKQGSEENERINGFEYTMVSGAYVKDKAAAS